MSKSAFERQVLDYARHWGPRRSRRNFLKMATGGAAAIAIGSAASQAGVNASPAKSSTQLKRSQDDGSTLKIARGQLTDTLDAQKTRLLVAHEVMWQIYDTLIYLDEEGTVHPGLATEWSFSDDNLTVTYTLRENVLFHDGTPFTAQIVKDTVTRHLDPATASPTVGQLGPLVEVQVIDDLTVSYVYSEPFVPMFVGLGYSYCAPIGTAAAAELGDEFGRNPVGTGPYKFVEWTADDTIILEKNEDHTWATSFYETQQPPQIDRVEYLVIPEDATRLSALITGEVDVITGSDAVPTDKINSLKNEPGVTVVTRPAVGMYYAGLNQKIKPLDDVRVRQAINHAIDAEAIVELILDGNGKPATSMVASEFGYYTPDATQYPYDPERAMELLTEAGLEDGFETTYLNISSPVYQRAAELIQEYLSAVNISISIESYPVAEWVPKGQSAEYGMQFFFYTGSDPNSIYSQLRTGQPFDWTYSEDEELNAWLDEQRVEFDFEKRGELFSQIQHRINDEALVLYLWEGVYAAAQHDNVEGVDIDLIGFVHLQEMAMTS